MDPGAIRSPTDGLRFLYVGTDDTEAEVAHFVGALGAELRWRFQAFGADVAGVHWPGTARPMVLLADHRPDGSVLPLFAVRDLDAVADEARAAGALVLGPEDTPEGPVIIIRRGADAPEMGFLRVDRPDALDRVWAGDQANHRLAGRQARGRPAAPA